ncbi:E3 ubiquitin-protein ligase RNF12-B-like [Limanda limanda]|uniref:E3 ubiquitin-protein ligase RNF12-B-like n=1 Tax=Limanda limanda TaxID=27771 RepID=UPI0029C725B5|nr:E3 ubiquitin-protein ligase RNF12-B-like [Limanda limanda]
MATNRERMLMELARIDMAEDLIVTFYVMRREQEQRRRRRQRSNYDKPSTARMPMDKGPLPSTSSSPEASPDPSTSSSPESSPEPSTSSSLESSPEPSTSSIPEASPEPSIPSPEVFVQASTSASLRPSLPASFTPSTAPASMMLLSPLSHTAKKRKRKGEHDDGGLARDRGDLEERRLALLGNVSQPDEFARFCQTVEDMVTMPPEKRPTAMSRLSYLLKHYY